jgi:hypothetical protein
MGGATQLWAQGVLLLAVAVAFIWYAPRRSLGRYWNLIFIGLAAVALPEFLPARCFVPPGWRQVLTGQFALRLPLTLSAQPWLSAQACLLYFAGLGWAYYLLAHSWTISDRQKAVRFYGLGITALAAVCLAAYLGHFKVPFWPAVGNSPINFGFFPNRNQTANVLALGAVMMTAVTYETFERRQSKRGVFWLAAILITCLALVIDYSRAGVVLFFGGAAAWVAWTIPTSRSKRISTLCLAGVVLMLAAFLLYGGDTLKRFQPEPSDNALNWSDFRFSIQEDAVALAAQSPVLGQGLGNFEFLFPIYREKSAAQNRALHPESDWLWVAAELGWPAAILLLVGVAYWLPQCFPFERKTDRRLRSAAAVCGVAFALHGLADVSGHRAGAIWPALFFASLALHPKRRLKENAWVSPVFRCLGVLLALAGLWWLVSSFSVALDKVAPTSSTVARLRSQSDQSLAARDYPRVIATTTEALAITPLDWRLYFQRAVANAVSHSSTPKARSDFALARYLVPQWAESCFVEGEMWLALGDPDSGLDAWKEALRRAGDESPHLYDRMLADRPLNYSVREGLEDMARGNPEYWLVFLRYASPLECDLQIGGMLADDPALLSLTPEQRRSLFATWYERGNRPLLISNLLAYPAWLSQGWMWVAQDYVQQKLYRDAYELAMRYTPRPPMPHITSDAPINELERNFFFHSDEFQYGIDLFLAQQKLGRTADALATLQALDKIPGRPSYILYLEAEIYAEQKQWEQAWDARVKYGPLSAQ